LGRTSLIETLPLTTVSEAIHVIAPVITHIYGKMLYLVVSCSYGSSRSRIVPENRTMRVETLEVVVAIEQHAFES
jgi:hypothetical protein